MSFRILSLLCLVFSFSIGGLAFQCGPQAGNATCQGGLCCSKWGWCGATDAYCGKDCISQCPDDDSGSSSGTGSLSEIISESTFEQMLLHRSTPPCQGAFYTYDAFIKAAEAFPDFGNKGDEATRRREIAAFFGQTSHETTGGWPTAPDGPFAWGYCWVRELNPWSNYCDPNFPCPKEYYGRGPIQLSWNYNYAQCGDALGLDLINNPELLETDPVISFKSAIWFWMTAQPPKPSCHDVMTGSWQPSADDLSANRLPGYGLTTNIINGGLECGFGPDSRVQNRIGFYLNYTARFNTDPGDNLDCFSQRPFGFGLAAVTM